MKTFCTCDTFIRFPAQGDITHGGEGGVAVVHPEIGSGWHEIEAYLGERSPAPAKLEANVDVYIGRFRSDGKYHLLGHRPIECRAYFCANECSSLDLGLVELPDGKANISDLVKGDVVTVRDGKKSWKFTYVKR